MSELHRRAALLLTGALGVAGCMRFGAVDLAPEYEEPEFVVPDSWHGMGPFVEATPSDDVLRKDWWTLFGDAQLDLATMQGSLVAEWFDPTTGQVVDAGPVDAGATVSFTTPGENGAGESDWVLRIVGNG